MPRRDRVLLRELLALGSAARDPLLLAALAGSIPPAAHQRALAVARTFEPAAQALALGGLGHGAQALTIAREIDDEQQRAHVLARLIAGAPDPEAVSAEVVRIALDGAGYRAALIGELGASLTPAARRDAAHRLIHGPAYPSLSALWNLVPELDEATRAALVNAAVEAGPQTYPLLARLNRPVSAEQSRRMSATVLSTLLGTEDRLFGLDIPAALRYLPADAIGPLTRRTAELENPFHRQYAIEGLAPVADAAVLAVLRAALRDDMRNPEAEFEVVLREFELAPSPVTARSLAPFLSGRLLRRLNRRLRDRLPALPSAALDLLLDVDLDQDGREFLRSVRDGPPRPPAEVVAEAIEGAAHDADLVAEASARIESGALDRAEPLGGDVIQAFGYIQLIRRRPAGDRAPLVHRALELINAADLLVIRCWLLARLFDVLTGPERAAVLTAVDPGLRPLVAPVRDVLAAELARLLESLPTREGLAAIESFLTGFDGPDGALEADDQAERVWMFCLPRTDHDDRPLAAKLAERTERNPFVPLGRGAEPKPLPPGRAPDWTLTGPRPRETSPAVVNTGFAPADRPDDIAPADRTLAAGSSVLFWLGISAPAPGSIEVDPAALPAAVPAEAELTVAVFAGEIEVDPAAAIGLLRLAADGSATVSRPAARVGDPALARLYFPVRLPSAAGLSTLRCNLYANQVLVESRLVEVWTTTTPEHRPGALRSTVDYRIADLADFPTLSALPAHTASVLHDAGVNGTHSLRVLTTDGVELLRADAEIESAQLTAQIRMARAALGRVAWGSDQPWRPGMPYRYQQSADDDRLTEDLGRLAANGYRLHHLLMRALARSAGRDTFELAERVGAALARPGFVQVALNESANHVLPAAMLYDLPLDTNAQTLRLCEDFRARRADSPCFAHACAQARQPDPTVVCPGGFWGFRHALGLPVSLGSATMPPSSLGDGGPTRFTAGVYRDFATAAQHCGNLRTLAALDWRLADDREGLFRELTDREPEVVYFYCHGGVQDELPYLRVGRGMSGPVITPDNFYQRGVRWATARPLVFLNGCRTADLSPERAIDFVSYFVEEALACGVIGTEITVFEQFAAEFAEECLRHFLAGTPIGQAVTRSRIALLGRGNPLGLAYIPFVLPSIRLTTT